MTIALFHLSDCVSWKTYIVLWSCIKNYFTDEPKSLISSYNNNLTIVRGVMELSCKSLKDPSRGRTNMGYRGRMNILCAMFILPLCSFCPEIYWSAANSFIVQNKWPKYFILAFGCVCSHISLLCYSKATFLHKNVSVQSAPPVFVLPRLSIFGKTVIVFKHPCKWNFGGQESQTNPLSSEHFIFFCFGNVIKYFLYRIM